MDKVILIVEDDSQNLKLLRDVLQIFGYMSLEATDGKQGVEIATERKPDLILMDIQMPVMNGLEATRILKANPETTDIPIIALTGYAMKGDETRISEAGCDAYLSKPFDIRELEKKVAEYF